MPNYEVQIEDPDTGKTVVLTMEADQPPDEASAISAFHEYKKTPGADVGQTPKPMGPIGGEQAAKQEGFLQGAGNEIKGFLPDFSKGHALRSALKLAWPVGNPLTAYDAIAGLGAGAGKEIAASEGTHGTESKAHALAALIPGAGPFAAQTGENLGGALAGDPGKMGRTAVDAAAFLGMSAGPKGSPTQKPVLRGVEAVAREGANAAELAGRGAKAAIEHPAALPVVGGVAGLSHGPVGALAGALAGAAGHLPVIRGAARAAQGTLGAGAGKTGSMVAEVLRAVEDSAARGAGRRGVVPEGPPVPPQMSNPAPGLPPAEPAPPPAHMRPAPIDNWMPQEPPGPVSAQAPPQFPGGPGSDPPPGLPPGTSEPIPAHLRPQNVADFESQPAPPVPGDIPGPHPGQPPVPDLGRGTSIQDALIRVLQEKGGSGKGDLMAEIVRNMDTPPDLGRALAERVQRQQAGQTGQPTPLPAASAPAPPPTVPPAAPAPAPPAPASPPVDLVQAILKVKPEAAQGALINIADLRSALADVLPGDAFDKALLEANTGAESPIQLQSHATPSQLKAGDPNVVFQPGEGGAGGPHGPGRYNTAVGLASGVGRGSPAVVQALSDAINRYLKETP